MLGLIYLIFISSIIQVRDIFYEQLNSTLIIVELVKLYNHYNIWKTTIIEE